MASTPEPALGNASEGSGGQLSESEWIHHIGARTPVRPGSLIGVGDDAALLEPRGFPVVCHDMVVEGVHFRRDNHSWSDVGHKAVAVNLSDLAAMGATPQAALIGLGLPQGGLPDGALGDLYRGIDHLAAEVGMSVVGGDITRTPVVVIGLTAVGYTHDPEQLLTRTSARPGDGIYVTGPLGAAAAGLWLLEQGIDPATVDHGHRLVAAQRRPMARLTEGHALIEAGGRCAMDLSDGLAIDAERLAAASGVAAHIDLDMVPIADGVAEVARRAGRSLESFGVAGGEDYELLVVLGEAQHGAAAAAGVPLWPVGRIEAGHGLHLHRAGRTVTLASRGWEVG